MFDEQGRPKGYGQHSPFVDQPKPPGDVPLQKAGSIAAPAPPPPPSMPQDPSMAAWRGGQMNRKLGEAHGQPPAPAPVQSPLQSAIGSGPGSSMGSLSNDVIMGGTLPPSLGAPPPTMGQPPAPAAQGNFAMPQGNWRDPAFVQSAMDQANNAAYNGQKKHTDPSYWTDPRFNGDGAYIWDRMLGKGAGGADAALSGQWAGGDPEAMKRTPPNLAGAIQPPTQNPTSATTQNPTNDPNAVLQAVMQSLQQQPNRGMAYN